MSTSLSLADKVGFLWRAWKQRWFREPAQVAFARRHLQEGQSCVEIGGHLGAFAYWMQRRVGPSGRVVVFEPQPELATYLEAAAAALRLPRFEIVCAAVSSQAGARQLFRATSSPSPQAALEPDASRRLHSIPVRVETLDDFFAEHAGRPIDLIHCDVGGHELEVFRGAEEILAEDRPILLVGRQPRSDDPQAIAEVVQYLKLFEYTGEFFQRGRLRPLPEFDHRGGFLSTTGICNLVFRPKPGQDHRIDASEWALHRRAG